MINLISGVMLCGLAVEVEDDAWEGWRPRKGTAYMRKQGQGRGKYSELTFRSFHFSLSEFSCRCLLPG